MDWGLFSNLMWSSKVNEPQAYKLDYLKIHSASLDFSAETKSSKNRIHMYMHILYMYIWKEFYEDVFWYKATTGIIFIIFRYLEVLFPKEICFLSTYTPVNKLIMGG